MTDEASLEQKIAELNKHLQSQARFTRTLVVVCMAGIVAVNLWMVMALAEIVPSSTIMQTMERLPVIFMRWKLLEVSRSTKGTPTTMPAAK